MSIIDIHFFHVKDKGQFSLFATIAILLLFTSMAFYNNVFIGFVKIYMQYEQGFLNIILTIH